MNLLTILNPVLKYKLIILIGLGFFAGWKVENWRHSKIALKEYKRGLAEAKKQAEKDTKLLIKYRDRITQLEAMTEQVLEDANKISNSNSLSNPEFIRLLNKTR